MKQKEIKLLGKQVFGNEDELEKDEVYVEFDVQELLDEIDNEDIENYARYSLDMMYEDDFESSLDDFNEEELVEALEDLNYNFSSRIDEDLCVEYLKNSGYFVTDKRSISNDYDYVDNCLFMDISSVFDSLSCTGRQELRDLIIKNFR